MIWYTSLKCSVDMIFCYTLLLSTFGLSVSSFYNLKVTYWLRPSIPSLSCAALPVTNRYVLWFLSFYRLGLHKCVSGVHICLNITFLMDLSKVQRLHKGLFFSCLWKLFYMFLGGWSIVFFCITGLGIWGDI
jgi:hypothetical protein